MEPGINAALAVVGYARVSSDEQARGGVSLAAQAEKIRQYARLHDLELRGVVEDAGASAKSLDRPGLARVLALLDSAEVGGVVIYKLDRLTRSLADWSALIDRYFGRDGGPRLLSVSDSIDTRSASGRMVLNVMMTMAQWERETIVERTRVAMTFKRSRSERISGPIPFGCRLVDDGRRSRKGKLPIALAPDPAEVAALAEIRRWHAEGWTLRRIAAELDARGIPTRSGRPWSFSTVRTLLRRPPT